MIEIESLTIELDELDLSEKQRLHLAQLIDTSIHHTILDAIFSELSDQDKIELFKYLTSQDNDRIWQLLNSKVDNVEEKIKSVADELKKQLKEDITEASDLQKQTVKGTKEKKA